MVTKFQAFDPSLPPMSGIIDTHGVNVGEQLMIYNDSLSALALEFADGSKGTVPPTWNKDYISETVPMGKVKWSVDQTVTISATGYPVSKVYGEIYEKEERVASVNAGMNRGFTLTGGGAAVLSTANNLVHDSTTAVGEQFIEASYQPAGVTKQTFNISTDGTVTISEIISGVITPMLQTFPGASIVLKLASATKLVEVENELDILGLTHAKGNLTVDGNSAITGTNTVTGNETVTGIIFANGSIKGDVFTNNVKDNVTGAQQMTLATAGITVANLITMNAGIFLPNNTILKSEDADHTARNLIWEDATNHVNINTGPGGLVLNVLQAIFCQLSGGAIVTMDGRGVVLASTVTQGITFPNGGFLPNLSFFTGAGSGTFNHGFGSAPFWVAPICDVVGSETQGYDTVTATQVHVTVGAALAFKAGCF